MGGVGGVCKQRVQGAVGGVRIRETTIGHTSSMGAGGPAQVGVICLDMCGMRR